MRACDYSILQAHVHAREHLEKLFQCVRLRGPCVSGGTDDRSRRDRGDFVAGWRSRLCRLGVVVCFSGWAHSLLVRDVARRRKVVHSTVE